MRTSSISWRARCRKATRSLACFSSRWGGLTRTGTEFGIRSSTRTRTMVWECTRCPRLLAPAEAGASAPPLPRAGAASDAGPQSLILNVFRHAPQSRFCGVQIAGGVDGDAFSHGAVRSIRLVGRNEHRHLAVFETPDPDPFEPARVNSFGRLRVGRVDDVVPVDGQPADAAEVVVLSEKLPFLRQDLDAMVVAGGDDQAAPGS